LLLPMAQALAATGQFAKSHETLQEILGIPPADQLAQRVEVSAWCARVEHLLGLHEQAHNRLISSLEGLRDELSREGLSLLIELMMDGLNRMECKSIQAWPNGLSPSPSSSRTAAADRRARRRGTRIRIRRVSPAGAASA
jgi:hypothetical protein